MIEQYGHNSQDFSIFENEGFNGLINPLPLVVRLVGKSEEETKDPLNVIHKLLINADRRL